ncbi:MAG TPA: hypothetical protein VFW03_01110 [Gemmatimonadaceae bacterium]|nr:hypothetical protein [Gemmatimonadaceae bacterium]
MTDHFDLDAMRSEHAERAARLTVMAIVVTLVVVSIAYRVLVMKHLEHTSLVFIGLPALAAVTLLHTRPRTAIGTVNKVIAILLCLSGILFGEGLICILMAAPIFFLVGTAIGLVINKLTGRNWRGMVSLVVVPLSLEGVVPSLAFDREERVTVSRIVDATPDQVRLALASTPRFDRELPRFFRLGFPTPMHVTGEGLRVGDDRRVMFAHGQHHTGALVMRVTRTDSASALFTMASDSSYITHWLSWEEADVRWTPVGAGHTRVTWTLRYRRRLDPAWYFAPLERYGAGLAAGYLIETLATPRTPVTR